MLQFCNKSFLHANDIIDRPWCLILTEVDSFNDVLVVVMEFYQMFVCWKKLHTIFLRICNLFPQHHFSTCCLKFTKKKLTGVMWHNNYNLIIHFNTHNPLPSVPWHCWLGDRNGIWPIKPVPLIPKGFLWEQMEKKLIGNQLTKDHVKMGDKTEQNGAAFCNYILKNRT